MAAVLCFAVAPRVADAHLGNLSYADFAVAGNEVSLRFRYAVHVTPGFPEGQTTTKSRAELLALQPNIEAWFGDTVRVDSGGKRCALTIDNLVGPDENEDLELHAFWTCEVASIEGLRINFHPLQSVMQDWQTVASMKFRGETLSTVLSPGATRWTVGEPGPVVSLPGDESSAADTAEGAEEESSFLRFFHLGVEHIWTGYDHLLFLLAVLLAGGGIARLAAIVTSFTVAHSITLGAASTGLVQLPVAPVEAVIALSIVFVAAENMLGRGADRRALVTFAFGLIHGFGFASILAEVGLPASGVLVPLLAFNLGVEAGQLAVVVVVVPILSLLLRGAQAQRIRFALSALIALAGLAWAVERVAAIVA